MSYTYRDWARDEFHQRIIDSFSEERFEQAFEDPSEDDAEGEFFDAVSDLEDALMDELLTLVDGIPDRVHEVEREFAGRLPKTEGDQWQDIGTYGKVGGEWVHEGPKAQTH